MKKTRQGVRDLNHIHGKSKGRKVEMPETFGEACSHPRDKQMTEHGISECLVCGGTFDCDGNAR